MTGTNSFPAHAPDTPLADPLPVADTPVLAAITALQATIDNGVDVNIVAYSEVGVGQFLENGLKPTNGN